MTNKIVNITGITGIGKSAICSYIAWYFNNWGAFEDGIVYIDFGLKVKADWKAESISTDVLKQIIKDQLKEQMANKSIEREANLLLVLDDLNAWFSEDF